MIQENRQRLNGWVWVFHVEPNMLRCNIKRAPMFHVKHQFGLLLLSDAEAAKNLPQQILRGEFASYGTQRCLSLAKLLG